MFFVLQSKILLWGLIEFCVIHLLIDFPEREACLATCGSSDFGGGIILSKFVNCVKYEVYIGLTESLLVFGVLIINQIPGFKKVELDSLLVLHDDDD